MKKNIPIIYIVLAIIILSSSACETILSGKKISEGKIVYDIEYLDDSDENSLITLLPKTMTLKFKNNNTSSGIGLGGLFSLSVISDLESKKSYTLLNIWGQKYIQTINAGEEPAGYNMPNFTIKETKEEIEIAGYKCHVALLDCENNEIEQIKLFYTKDINIKDSNSNNPFNEIDGVLMGFQLRLLDLNMKFKAKKVIEEKIDDSEFQIPDGYETVTKEEMENILKDFQD